MFSLSYYIIVSSVLQPVFCMFYICQVWPLAVYINLTVNNYFQIEVF